MYFFRYQISYLMNCRKSTKKCYVAISGPEHVYAPEEELRWLSVAAKYDGEYRC
jgi:hypothetical protein